MLVRNVLEVISLIGTPHAGGSSQPRYIRIPDIIRRSLHQERSAKKIVTFNVNGDSANYNIKFKSEQQSGNFCYNKVTFFF